MRFTRLAMLGVVALALLACGGVSVPTIPPIVVPTIAPGPVPTPGPGGSVDPAAGMCRLLTVAEVGAVMGSTVSITDSQTNRCTYTSAQTYATIMLRTETGDASAARFLLGNTAKDITVGSYSGLSGTFLGGPLVYVQRGNEQLVLQGVLLGSDDASVAKVVQLANTAAPRW